MRKEGFCVEQIEIHHQFIRGEREIMKRNKIAWEGRKGRDASETKWEKRGPTHLQNVERDRVRGKE